MVKNKKMSKSSIAIIVLALLLVLSMVMGLTGAWFTARHKASSQNVNFKFGNVSMTMAAETQVSNDDNGDNTWFGAGEIDNVEKDDSGVYELIAGSRIRTKITITNTSTVDAYYLLKSTKLNGFFVVNETTKKLVKVTSGEGLDMLTNLEGRTFSRMYQVAVVANGDQSQNHVDQTETAHIFQVYVGDATYDNYGSIAEKNPAAPAAAIWEDVGTETGYYTYAGEVLQYGAIVDLGALLVSGEFELRAVQADNMTAAEAYTYLTTEANYADIVVDPQP